MGEMRRSPILALSAEEDLLLYVDPDSHGGDFSRSQKVLGLDYLDGETGVAQSIPEVRAVPTDVILLPE